MLKFLSNIIYAFFISSFLYGSLYSAIKAVQQKSMDYLYGGGISAFIATLIIMAYAGGGWKSLL